MRNKYSSSHAVYRRSWFNQFSAVCAPHRWSNWLQTIERVYVTNQNTNQFCVNSVEYVRISPRTLVSSPFTAMFVLSNRMWYDWVKQTLRQSVSTEYRLLLSFHKILMNNEYKTYTSTALTTTPVSFCKCTPIWHGCLRSSNSFIPSPRNVEMSASLVRTA